MFNWSEILEKRTMVFKVMSLLNMRYNLLKKNISYFDNYVQNDILVPI